MRSEGEVRATVADLIMQLTHVPSGDVEASSALKELGVDSLLTIELADELGRRYDLYLSDEAVDAMRTVDDVVRAVVRHDGAVAPAWVAKLAAPPAWSVEEATVGPPVAGSRIVDTTGTAGFDPEVLRQEALTVYDEPLDRGKLKVGGTLNIAIMAVVGILVGVGLGFGASGALDSAGLGKADLPPLTTTPTTEPTDEPTETPSPEPTAEETAEPEPTLTTSASTVPPGERFTLEGVLPQLDAGAPLRVQVRETESDAWEDFPVDFAADEGGAFHTQVYTSRTGAREWRVTALETEGDDEVATPPVTVTIG
ncbi:MAG: acyl carrier protein [Aeromicrobium sp.]|uniref:acyl carrier protein n=1 Tax=Aeromicrobium sp. TaxID=1871063 RepID=UPI0039E481E0